MKIIDITATVVNAEMRNWVFVKVETDQPGLYGWGEATLEWKTRAVVGAIEDLKPLVIGRDPRDIEQAMRAMTKHGFWRMGVIGRSAMSGIEQALWDISGKELGVPVWRLLGGRTRDRVKVYTHLGLGDMRAVYETFEPGPLAERACALVESGYGALKVVFIPYTHYTTTPRALRHVGRLMESLRQAVGPDVDLMVDFHGRCASTSAALQFIEELAPFDPLFVEEPIPPGDTEGMREIVLKSRVPIATGERLVSREEFWPLFERRALHIAQPDLCHCGGIGEGRKIASAAETVGVGIAPHNPLGPIAGVVALHFDIATPNFVIQEEMVGAVPWYGDVVQGPIRRVDGHWQLPSAPGLGVEVDEAVAARHPFKPEVLHTLNAVLDDGTIVDW
ncbi:MAG TPA: galactonate dehydratase [Microvirga sp.]|jgi:galactonate dehydratase